MEIPPFHPHPLLRGGHLQTIAGVYLPGERWVERAARHHVDLPDGDQIVLHDDQPAGWRSGTRVALLLHGLAGSHASPYMQRIANKLTARGLRVFRMDLRGSGAGASLARLPYHGGCSPDASAALGRVAELCPGSPVLLAGFSLGGNIVLKLLGEQCGERESPVDRAVVVSPPIDLSACVEQLRCASNWLYDRHFVRLLMQQVADRQRTFGDSDLGQFKRRPRGLAEFDATFTAPVCGFGTSENYYRQASSAPLVARIRVPTLIVASQDDPLVPVMPFQSLAPSAHVRLLLTRHGGHLGFVGSANGDPDRRWMDWRVVQWATAEHLDIPNEAALAVQKPASALG